MFKRVKEVVVLWALISVAGCAYAEVRPIKSTDVEGIRFYRPWPYLWVVNAEKGGCTFTVNYLPDTSQEYIIIPHTGVGSLTVSPTLAEGWNLIALQTTADSKTAELINAISGIAGNIAGPAGAAINKTAPKGFGPGLYRFEFEKGKVNTLAQVFSFVDGNGNPVTCGTAPR
jgi:hypothetical protein